MTRVERQVVGLDDEAARGVEVVVDLGELGEAAVVVEGRIATDAALAHERRALHGDEDHRVAAHLEASLGVASVQRERRRRSRDLLEHEVGVEAHDVVLDDLPGLAEEAQCLGMVECDPDLLKQAPPAALDRGHGILAQHLVVRHAVAEHARKRVRSRRDEGADARPVDRRTHSRCDRGERASRPSAVGPGAMPARTSSPSRYDGCSSSPCT